MSCRSHQAGIVKRHRLYNRDLFRIPMRGLHEIIRFASIMAPGICSTTKQPFFTQRPPISIVESGEDSSVRFQFETAGGNVPARPHGAVEGAFEMPGIVAILSEG